MSQRRREKRKNKTLLIDIIFNILPRNYIINKNDFDNIIFEYVIYLFKLIRVKRYVINKSNEFNISYNKLTIDNKILIDNLICKITNGFDVNKFRNIKCLLNYKEEMNSKDGLDYCLYKFGIHHLHLKEYPNRSDYFIFIIFKDDQCYLLDIRKHKDKNIHFNYEVLCDIIYSNWIKIFDKYFLDGIYGLIDNSEITVNKHKNLTYKTKGFCTYFVPLNKYNVSYIGNTTNMDSVPVFINEYVDEIKLNIFNKIKYPTIIDTLY